MRNLEEKRYWIWLSLIPNLGYKKKQMLLQKYKNPQIIYHLKEKELSHIKGIGEKTVKNILDEENKKKVKYHIEYMLKNNIDIISMWEKEYPFMLKNIYDPPISLYYKGDKSIFNNPAIGIVGCREATQYGESVARYFSYHLAKRQFNIISGLAKGIDSYAHMGTICVQKEKINCGKTIAVLGNGLDRIYPKENEKLAEQIVERGGMILSEYPLGTKPEKVNFPARNRIISGMSKGILVVEAKEQSGTLITVDFALEQGREVFVVPGNINSRNSIGTNRLIQQGARLITNVNEILGVFNIMS